MLHWVVALGAAAAVALFAWRFRALSWSGIVAGALPGRWLVAGGGAVAAVGLAGWLGSLLDSLLGAGLQAVYRCPACGRWPQVARHEGCSVRAVRVSGVPKLDNDMVNWLATGAGAAAGLVLAGVV